MALRRRPSSAASASSGIPSTTIATKTRRWVHGQLVVDDPAHLREDARRLRVPRRIDPEPVGKLLPLPGVQRDRRGAPVVPAPLAPHPNGDETGRPPDAPALAPRR